MQSTLAYRLETQQPEWAKLARLCRLEVDQVLHIAESVSELTFDGLLAAEAPASLHVQMYETTDTMLATVRRIVDVCEMLSMWPAGLIGLARLVKKKPHALLRATRLELVGLDLEVASGSLKYGATMCGVMAAIFLCGLEQLPADSFTRGPASVKRESSVNSGLTSASGASASGRQLSKLSLQHVHLGSRGSQALLAALKYRPHHTKLWMGFNAMPHSSALYFARALLPLEHVTIHGPDDGRIKEEDALVRLLRAEKPRWVDDRLFVAVLKELESADDALDETGVPKVYDKFTTPAKEMIFDPVASFTDGLYGLYRRMGINPDALTRSIRQEFLENDGGKWFEHFDYVVNQPAVETYPSSKGEAPGVPNDEDIRLAEPEERDEYERLKKPYTRDWQNTGKTLADFVAAQPKQELRERLSPAEVAVLRLYTGPIFSEWNTWARFNADRVEHDRATGDQSEEAIERRHKWATSLAVLYNAVLKLSSSSDRSHVFRGVKEDRFRLPDFFLPRHESFSSAPPKAAVRKPFQDRGFAGGIEKAFMSTSLDPETALQYSSSKESRSGAIFQIEFDIASRGADVQWLSQYPAERELLYPPCTSLTCTDMVEIGEKKILQVTATVSTRRPDVSWCEHCDSTPPEHELGHRPPVHNEIGPFRSTPLADAGEVECELAPGISGGTYKLDLVVGAGEQRRPATFTGELSPLHAVTLSKEARRRANIPHDAAYFAFAYPITEEQWSAHPDLAPAALAASGHGSIADLLSTPEEKPGLERMDVDKRDVGSQRTKLLEAIRRASVMNQEEPPPPSLPASPPSADDEASSADAEPAAADAEPAAADAEPVAADAEPVTADAPSKGEISQAAREALEYLKELGPTNVAAQALVNDVEKARKERDAAPTLPIKDVAGAAEHLLTGARRVTPLLALGGGFFYFSRKRTKRSRLAAPAATATSDEAAAPAAATAAMPPPSDAPGELDELALSQINILEALGQSFGGLHFEGPYMFGKKCAGQWEEALTREKRLHDVTYAHLRSIGARRFCWLNPNEVKGEMERKEVFSEITWPHGAFAYFYPEGEAHFSCLFRVTPQSKAKLVFARPDAPPEMRREPSSEAEAETASDGGSEA